MWEVVCVVTLASCRCAAGKVSGFRSGPLPRRVMRATTIVGIAFVAAGCASGPPTVLDADYGRLKPDQTAAVDSARAELASAHQELEAAKGKVAEARREEKLAESDRAAAKSETERVKKLAEAADALSSAADAHGEYAGTLIDARKAAEEAAQRRVDLANAKVELLKLQALEQAKLEPTKAYDDKTFYGRVAEMQKRLDDAREKVKQLEQDATDDQRRWDDRKRKVPAAAE
jgi:chromosome segregation ATPase